jgi:outer membrane lipoprotein-sorting protein
MKKGVLIILLSCFASAVFCQTADEVINKFIEASGGRQKLNRIKTLQYVQTVTMNTALGDFKMPMQFFKEKNKLFRAQASIAFGAQSLSFFAVVTDTAGYIMLPAVPMMGSEGGITKMTESERSSQADQLDAAGMFAPLVDYGAKGNKLQLLTEEKVNNEDCYQIKLTSKSGGDAAYFISKATNLVVRTDTEGSTAASMNGLGSLMGGLGAHAGKTSITTLYSNYADVQGVKLPTRVTIKNQLGDAESEITGIKINEPIDAKWYKAE